MSPRRHMEPEQFGPYTLVRHLATGGMGELYLAQREGVAGFSKQLVVKRIRTELVSDREFVDMFLTEGRIAAMLDHPNVVHISDLGEVDGIYYMAMEYIAGRDLGTLLARVNGPLRLPVAIYIMSSLCEGVSFAHSATGPGGQPLHLVHRDINPQNVLLSYQGSVSITDFGIAKVRAFQTNETRAGVLKGKFGYLAPEQARSSNIDRRTDIYALGLLLFEVTTGQRAIPGRSETELLYAAAEGLTQRPSAVSDDYPRQLETIYNKATATEPEQRYQTVRQFHEDLLGFQMEQRMVVTSGILSELMQRMFANEWSEERKLLTPTSSRRPSKITQPLGSGLQGAPDGQVSDGSPPKEASVRQFVNAPTLHDANSGSFDPDMDGETVTDLPEYNLVNDGLVSRPSAVPTNVKPSIDPGPTLPPLSADPTAEPVAIVDAATASRGPEVDPALAAANTAPVVRDEPVDPVLAAAQTQLLDTSQHAPPKELDDDEPLLKGGWTEEEDAKLDRPPRSRLPIILASMLFTLGAAAGAAYYFVFLTDDNGGSQAVHVDGKAVASVDGTVPDSTEAVSAPLGQLDAGGPDTTTAAVSPDATSTASVTPDAARTPPRAPDLGQAITQPAEAQKGRVRISCTPQVQVFWKGRRLGKTPTTASISAGRQRLTLRNAKLGIRVGRRVTVKANGLTRLQTKVEQGVLVVKARPWAHVEIDGARRGTTPIKPIRLYEGTHRVKLTNTDKGQTHKAKVVIRPGEVTKIVHRFR